MTTNWPAEKRAALDAFYGKRELKADGTPTAAWLKASLTAIQIPYPMVLSWQTSEVITRIQCHRLVARSCG